VTTYQNTSANEGLRFHDLLRVTLTAGGGFFSALLPTQALAENLQLALDAIYSSTALDYAVPDSASATVAETVAVLDFLVVQQGEGHTTGEIVAQIENTFGVFSNVSVSRVKKVIGGGVLAPGTLDAGGQYGLPGTTDQQASAAAAQSAANAGDWLQTLERDVGVAGKWFIVGGAALAIYLLVKNVRQLTR
jgi:hypothetical protein